MSSPRVSNVGKAGTRVTFSIGGRNFTTGALTADQAANLTVDQANALIASGQASASAGSYLAQFPWTTPPSS